MSLRNGDPFRDQKNRIIKLFKKDHPEEALNLLRKLKGKAVGDAEVHYLEGMIYSASRKYAAAISGFEATLRLAPDHAESEFELGVIDMALCRFNKARVHLRRAHDLNYRRREINDFLRQIEKVAHAQDVRLTACLIVKDEEKYLPGCLASLESVCDEIVVVDTGSRDSTVAIAESFGARIFHYQWTNDFAAARNFANRQATGDWIIQLDADEELFPEDQNKVRELIHQGACDGAYLAIHNRVSNSFGESSPSLHYLVRLFRNRDRYIYRNAVHEVLSIDGDVSAVDINLLHHGYNLDSESMQVKRKRNSEILYKRLDENPESPTTLFYLSMMHLGNRDFEKAASFAKQTLARIDIQALDKQHIALMTLNNLALINHHLDDIEAAKEYSRQAMAVNENYLDPRYFLGLAYFKEKDLEQARRTFETYLEKHRQLSERPVFNLFGSSSDYYLTQVCHFLGKIYRKQGDATRAIELISRAVELNPNFWVGLVDLGYIFIDQQDWPRAVDALDKAVRLARRNPEVNENNEAMWFDFTHAVRAYMHVLKKMKAEAQTSEKKSPNGAEYNSPGQRPG